jgi:hypothetical protein
LAVVLFATAAVAQAQTVPPVSTFTLGAPVRQDNGSARLPASFTVPGTVSVADARASQPLPKCGAGTRCGSTVRHKLRIVRMVTPVSAPGTLDLILRPTKSAKGRLLRGKRVKVPVEVTFTSGAGSVETQFTKVTLVHVPVACGRSLLSAHAACSSPAGY